MSEHEDLTLKRLKEFEPSEGYYFAFSGGKDSVVLKDLAIKAGVKFDAHYSVTTIDPPELVRFIKRYHSDVIWERPEKAFLTLLVTKGFPRRQGRWCCEVYKENGGSGRVVLTGIRAAESAKRRKRRMVENCTLDHTKHYVHPIIDWTEEEVWRYIRKYQIPYCELYDEGFKRLGCLFCPMRYYKWRQAEVRRYPRYAEAFRKAFRKLHATGRDSMKRWENGDEMFDWWIGNGLDERKQQIMHFDSDDLLAEAKEGEK